MRTSQDCWSCFRRVTLWRQKLTIIKCDCCIDEERYYKDHYTRRRIECHGETRYSTYVIRIFSVFFGNDSFSHKNQRIQNPPHAGDAAHNSYVSGNKKRQECFEGTRETILGEIEAWIVRPDGHPINILHGIAGIGNLRSHKPLHSVLQTLVFSAPVFSFRGTRTIEAMGSYFSVLSQYDPQFACSIGAALKRKPDAP
jgi:hypothetical protein